MSKMRVNSFKVNFTTAGSSGAKVDDNKPILTLGTAKLQVDEETKTGTFLVDKSKLPARPYSSDPEPLTVGPEDPTDLQQVFQMVETSEGILNNVVKMYNALFTKGHEFESTEMKAHFNQGFMPDLHRRHGVNWRDVFEGDVEIGILSGFGTGCSSYLCCFDTRPHLPGDGSTAG